MALCSDNQRFAKMASGPMKMHRPITSSELDYLEDDSEPSAVNLSTQPAQPSIAFGPFRLWPKQRLFLEGDKSLRLGSRALDILIALLEHPGDLVTKQELIARVWPGILVGEDNLKVHVAALRRALRDGQAGNRYICTVPGRGYCFVAPVVRSDGPMFNSTRGRLPTSPAPSVSGRDYMATLAAQMSQQHFITVVGAGEMAKGIFLTAALMGDYLHGVRFVDLEQLSDPLQMPSAVCAAIGIEASSCDPLAGIAAFLEGKHMLLVLDNCRHVIGATAAFAASLLSSAPSVHILAISR